MPPIARVFIVASVLAGAALFGRGTSDPNTIKIVSSLPRTGSAKQQNDTIVNGIRMALEEVDHRVGDFRIEYYDWDDATAAAGNWTSERETSNAIRASQDPDIMVYIGTYNSGAAKVAMPILNRAGLLMVSPANTAVELTKPELTDPRELAGLRPSGASIFAGSSPAMIGRPVSPPSRRASWELRPLPCSTTTKSMARASLRCSLNIAANWESRWSIATAST